MREGAHNRSACIASVALAALAVLVGSCGGGSTPAPAPTGPPATTPAGPEPLAAVPHDGPLRADPAFHDCGTVPEGERCEADFLLTNSAEGELVIESISQNASPDASIGLVEHRTGFTRDLPYTMGSETLRLLFTYQRREPNDEAEGSLFVRYRDGAGEHRLELPVRAR